MAQAGQPAAVGSAPPGPSSLTLDDQPPAVAADDDVRGRAAGVLGDVRQRLGDDEVGGGLDDRRRALLVARPRRSPPSARARRAPAPRRRGRGRSARAARCRARGRAARRSPRPPPRGPAHERGHLGAVGELLLGATDEHAQRQRGAPARRHAGRARCAAARRPARRRAAARARQLVDALDQLALALGVQAVAVDDERVDRQRNAEAERRPHGPEHAAARQRPDHTR